jgi:hypothetical protein
MRKFQLSLVSLFFLFYTNSLNSQILVSLIFGDALNSPKTQFGLEIGANASSVSNFEIADFTAGFEIGMFFNWKIKDNWALYSGLIANSNRGFKGEEVLIDPIYRPGNNTGYNFSKMQTRIVYVGIHSSMRYYLAPSFSVAGGLNIGLRSKAKNEAIYTKDKSELTVSYSIKDQISTLDIGPMISLIYQLRKGKGMSIIAKGYYGLVDVALDVPDAQNSFFFQLTAGILIGAKKAEEIEKELGQ